jgi:Protein of unknown function (DUF2442)
LPYMRYNDAKRDDLEMNTLDVDDLHARAVEFTATELVVTLMDGRKIATPLDWYPRLKRASAEERANFEISTGPTSTRTLASPAC